MTDTTEYDGIPDDEIWNIDFTDLEFKKEIARGSFGKGTSRFFHYTFHNLDFSLHWSLLGCGYGFIVVLCFCS